MNFREFDKSAQQEGCYVSDWADIIPINDTAELPPFPTGILPAQIAEYIRAVATSYHVPEDMPAMLALAITGTALQGRVIIRPQQKWIETASLYTMVLMESGQRKSPVFREILKPLKEFEKSMQEQQSEVLAENRTARELLDRERRQAIAENNKERAFEIDKELLMLPELYEYRLTVDNLTSEKLAMLLKENPQGLGLFAPEADCVENIAGKYSNGRSDCKLYLRAFSGDGFCVDRIGRSSLIVDNPALSIGLCVQPTIIENLQHKREFREVGLLPRFLFSVPKPLEGNEPFNKADIPAGLQEHYDSTITDLLCLWQEQTQRTEIGLSPEAEKVFAAYFESFQNPQDGLTEWRSKLRGQVLRIAAALSFLGGDYYSISGQAITGAIELAGYLEAHTKAAYGLLEADPETRAAQKILDWISRKDFTEFRIGELQKVALDKWADIKKASDLEPALHLLLDRNYLRIEKRETGGKPSIIYEINPEFKGVKGIKGI
jgi:hypothetical protein